MGCANEFLCDGDWLQTYRQPVTVLSLLWLETTATDWWYNKFMSESNTGDNVHELFPRELLNFRKPTEEEMQAFHDRNTGETRTSPHVEPLRTGPFREPTEEQIARNVALTCFRYGLPDPDTGEYPALMPSDEENMLVQYHVDESVPESWQNVANDRLNELQRLRAEEAGFDLS